MTTDGKGEAGTRLPPDVERELHRLAAMRGTTPGEALRRAVGTEVAFTGLANRGATVLVRLPGHERMLQVVFTPVSDRDDVPSPCRRHPK